jgi:hypothetical protein
MHRKLQVLVLTQKRSFVVLTTNTATLKQPLSTLAVLLLQLIGESSLITRRDKCKANKRKQETEKVPLI